MSTFATAFTTRSTSSSVVIAYATHIAIGGDPAVNPQAWGIGLGASGISGGPYHNNVRNLDGNTLGAQDNQLKGADLVKLPPDPHTFKVVVGWKDHDDRGSE